MYSDDIDRGYRFGVVSSTFPERGTVRVRIPDLDDLITGELWVIYPFTFADKQYWMPDIEQQVLCFFFGRGIETGVVLGGNYNNQDKPPVFSQDKHHVAYKDGTWFEYDRAAHHLQVHVKGDLTITATGKISITAGGNTAFRGARIDLN